MKPTSQLITIDPNKAKSFLTVNKGNRPVSETLVNQFADDMRAGRWKLNGDAIRFDEDDMLIDGQHRLYAIVKSGVTLQMFCIQGLPHEVFDTIDTGKRRSNSDILALRGEKNTNVLAGAIRILANYEQSPSRFGGSGGWTGCSAVKAEDVINRHPMLREFVSKCSNQSIKSLHVSVTLVAALLYIFWMRDQRLALEFLDGLNRGFNRNDLDPFFILREKLIRLREVKNQKPDMKYIAAIFIKAWNYKRAGFPVAKLSWAPEKEDFPVIN
jgi:hypothetical protein